MCIFPGQWNLSTVPKPYRLNYSRKIKTIIVLICICNELCVSIVVDEYVNFSNYTSGCLLFTYGQHLKLVRYLNTTLTMGLRNRYFRSTGLIQVYNICNMEQQIECRCMCSDLMARGNIFRYIWYWLQTNVFSIKYEPLEKNIGEVSSWSAQWGDSINPVWAIS